MEVCRYACVHVCTLKHHENLKAMTTSISHFTITPGVGTFHRRDHLKHDRIGEEVDFQKYFWKYRKKAFLLQMFGYLTGVTHHLLPVCAIPTVIWLGDTKNSRPCFRADFLSEHLCKNNCLKFDQMILLSQLQLQRS